jgi:glycosyltransferase involved in cell wall biosynthesis
MNLRIPETPPQILPLKDDTARPLISVMIPAYNCFAYLKSAMESVLEQDPGPEKMQIEVVDDCSTDGNVEALVHEAGKGRISFFRQETNKGSLRNFETCINRARGHWVHILHGDDQVKQGFYEEIETLFRNYPQAGAAFTGHSLIDSDGDEFWRDTPISPKQGILQDWLYNIAQGIKLQPPAIVVKRSVYEQIGSFFAVHFGEDWEMWVRIASKFSVAYSPECLASYRVHTNNITSRSFLSGQNVKDLKKVLKIIETYLPEQQRKMVMKLAKRNCSLYIASTAHRILYTYKEPKVALHQANSAIRLNQDFDTLNLVSKFYIKYLIHSLRFFFTNSQKKMKPNWYELVSSKE